MEWAGALLLVGVYGALLAPQVFHRGPPAWAVFLAGGGLFVGSGILPLGAAAAALDAAVPILLFLLALFVLTAGLEKSGAIEHLAHWLIGRSRDLPELAFALFLGLGVLSAFLVNDALVLLGVPLLILVSRRLGISPTPLLLTLAFAVTVGSVATPIGNPQNLLVALSSGFTAPFATFLRYLLVPTVLCLLLGGWYLRAAFRAEYSSSPLYARYPRIPLFPSGGWLPRLRRLPALWVFGGTMATMVGIDLSAELLGFQAVPDYLVALGGAAVLLAVSSRRVELVRRVNWTLMLLFGGLFLVVAGATSSGVVGSLESLLPIPGAHSGASPLPAIALTSLLGPQLFSNVPWVALQIPVLSHLGYTATTPTVWLGLAAMSTLAGNLTFLGAASNLIIVEQAERQGERLGLKEFVRHGAPMTAICVGVTFAALYFGI
ncbi:MAG TPA: SLC13 family permease [Thermoplasmata archaeon]|nr:SLC13 family permease [Thermoplasmata archaeon]